MLNEYGYEDWYREGRRKTVDQYMGGSESNTANDIPLDIVLEYLSDVMNSSESLLEAIAYTPDNDDLDEADARHNRLLANGDIIESGSLYRQAYEGKPDMVVKTEGLEPSKIIYVWDPKGELLAQEVTTMRVKKEKGQLKRYTESFLMERIGNDKKLKVRRMETTKDIKLKVKDENGKEREKNGRIKVNAEVSG